MASLRVDRAYFDLYNEDGKPMRRDPSPLELTQSVLRLGASLADVLSPTRVVGGPEWLVHRLGEQFKWAGSYAELPWLFDIDPQRLPVDVRDAVLKQFAATAVPLADGGLLLAVSDNPRYEATWPENRFSSVLLSVL